MQAPFDIAADLDTPVSAYLKLKALRPLRDASERGQEQQQHDDGPRDRGHL